MSEKDSLEEACMKRFVVIVGIIALLSACASAPAGSGFGYRRSSQMETADAPKWEPLMDGSTLAYNASHPYHPQEMKLSNGMLLRGENWLGYIKPYVSQFPAAKRHVILDAMTRYYTEYDRVEKVIRFAPLRYISGPYSSNLLCFATGYASPKTGEGFGEVLLLR